MVPITSQTSRIYPFQVLLPKESCGLSRASKAQAEQIRSIAVERIDTVAGQLSTEMLNDLDGAIRLHLAL